MRDGRYGKTAKWAIGYQQRVGEFFDAEDFVEVRLIHIDADRETIGDSGIAFLEALALLLNTANPVMAQGAAFANLPLVDRFTADITLLIRTGDTIYVDPAAGLVRIQEKRRQK